MKMTHVFGLAVALWAGAGGLLRAAPYGWGEGFYYQMGNGSRSSSSVPVAPDTTGVLSGKTVTAIAGGYDHVLALTSDGLVYSWGRGIWGQLGDGGFTDAPVPVAVDATGVLSTKTVTAIAAGQEFSLALTSDGKLFSWGHNDLGQLGEGTTTTYRRNPVEVDMTGVLSGKVVTAISAQGDTCLVLTSDNKLYSWGANATGQLGNGTTAQSSVPVAVDMSGALSGKTIVSIAAGWHCLAAASDGTVFGWGSNAYGTVGDGTTTSRSTPVAVDMSGALLGKSVVAVSGGYFHSLALTSGGRVYSWGYNAYGQLGDGTTTQRVSPVPVDRSGVLSGKKVTAISGLLQSLALLEDGQIAAWGYNADGAVGDGTTTDRTSPVAVDMTGIMAGQAATFINAGVDCSFALASPTTTTFAAGSLSYGANFSWLNWAWSATAADAATVGSYVLGGKIYAADVGWISLGSGTPASGIAYSQTGGDVGVNHDGAGRLAGYAYGANIGWIRFAQTWNSPPRIDLTTGALSGYAYSANCGWINLSGATSKLKPGSDGDVAGGGGDGIPDAWELEQLLAAGLPADLARLGATPGADADGDGVTDRDEYVADTNPFDPVSKPGVTGLTRDPATGQIQLQWTGSGRRLFAIQCSQDLDGWDPMGTAVAGSSASFSVSGDRFFFRVLPELPLSK